MNSTFRERYFKTTAVIIAGGAALLLLLAACATTHQVRSIQDPSGFLLDYSDLKEGQGGQAHMVYIRPDANWKQYTKVIIDPVQLWRGDEPDSPLGSLSQDDQQYLVDHLYSALKDSLSMDYQIVTEPGPDVMRLRAAITEARKTKPVLNLVSSVAPMGLGISFTKRIVFGTHTSVGLIQVEAELLDAQSGQRLAAAIDRRAGTKAWRTKFSGRWVDVREAFDYWGHRLQTRLAELRTQSS